MIKEDFYISLEFPFLLHVNHIYVSSGICLFLSDIDEFRNTLSSLVAVCLAESLRLLCLQVQWTNLKDEYSVKPNLGYGKTIYCMI